MSYTQDLIKKYKKVANTIIRAGMIPFPLTDTFIEILKYYLKEEDLDFIKKAFKVKTSLSRDELIKRVKMPEEEMDRIANNLAQKGFIFNQPSSKGIMVYRLLPIIVVGTFEYTFMKQAATDPAKKEEIEKLAKLYEKLMVELTDSIQSGYDNLVPLFEKQKAVDRTIPLYSNVDGTTIEINENIEAEENILPAQTVQEIINKFEDIAVGNCFCRQYRATLGHECKQHAPLESCFTFGKSARHTIAQGFARRISKEEALRILKETEDIGLVHKAFHNKSDIMEEENSICNCCKDCCDTFSLWRRGALPMVNSTNFVSEIMKDGCIGCGTCIERCPMDAISLDENDKAEVNQKICIGCGICAHFCPENTIKLNKGLRTVFIPPPRI